MIAQSSEITLFFKALLDLFIVVFQFYVFFFIIIDSHLKRRTFVFAASLREVVNKKKLFWEHAPVP